MSSAERDLEADVKSLKDWYSSQLHLPQNIGDEYFYNFVYGTNSLEKAMMKIDAYFTIRTGVLRTFDKIGPNTKAFHDHCQRVGMGVLPGTTPEGYRVLFSSSWNKEGEDYNSGCHLLKSLFIIEIGLSLWPTDASYVLVQDLKYMPNSGIKTINLRHIKGLSKLLRKALPIKMKKYCFFNSPPGLYTIMAVLRSVLTKKLNERIIFYRDDKKLSETLPMNMIPSEFNGGGTPLKELDEYWTNLFKSRENWFEEKLKLVSDENKRNNGSYQKEEVDLGIETLEID